MSGHRGRHKKKAARNSRRQTPLVQDGRGTSAQGQSGETAHNTLNVPRETPTNSGNDEDEVDGHLPSRSSGYVSHESHDSGMNEQLVPDCAEVTPNPPYLSEPQRGASGDANHHVLSSLPAPDQVPVYGVFQETTSAIGSGKILTSATRHPISIDDIRIQRTSTNQYRPEQHENASQEAGASVTPDPRPHLDFRNAAYPQFVTRQSRLLSFANWRSHHTHRPADFVECGMFFAGYADCVRCFYCGLGLKFWRGDDIPAYQHARYRPNCVYIIMCMGQSYVDRVQQDLQTQQANQTCTQLSVQAGEPTTCQGTAAATGQNCLTEDILLDVLSNLNAESTRLQNELQRDSDSEEDDDSDISTNYDETDHGGPIGVSHRHMGSVQASASATSDISEIQPSTSAEQPARVELDLQEEMRVVEREHTYLKQRTTCHVCHQRPVSSLYMPCGHVIACEPCADDATRCKLCGKVILGTANIYFA